MKTEILYRAKSKLDGKWVYGYPYKWINQDRWGIRNDTSDQEVDPETIGQFSTIPDKKKKKIFTGDLFKLGTEKGIFEVRFEHGCFLVYHNGKQYGLLGELMTLFIEKVGNIHDNPELLNIKL